MHTADGAVLLDSFFAPSVQAVLKRRHPNARPWIRPKAYLANGTHTTDVERVLDIPVNYPFTAWEAAELLVNATFLPDVCATPISSRELLHYDFQRFLLCDPVFFSDLFSALVTWYDDLEKGLVPSPQLITYLDYIFSGAYVKQTKHAYTAWLANETKAQRQATEDSVRKDLSKERARQQKIAKEWEPWLSQWLSTKKVSLLSKKKGDAR